MAVGGLVNNPSPWKKRAAGSGPRGLQKRQDHGGILRLPMVFSASGVVWTIFLRPDSHGQTS